MIARSCVSAFAGSGLRPHGSRSCARVAIRQRPQLAPLASFNGNGGSNGEDVGDRVIASLPYLLPLLDGKRYGIYLFMQYPFIARAFAPLAPLSMLYSGVPFLPLIVFLGVYAGIVNNQNLGRFVRLHASQAVLLDILLIVPQIFLQDIFRPPTDDFGITLYMNAFNTVFLFVTISVIFGMGSAFAGQRGRIPLVADAADSQVR